MAEPGNVRFDVLRSKDDPTRFVLYEVYRTPEDAAAQDYQLARALDLLRGLALFNERVVN